MSVKSNRLETQQRDIRFLQGLFESRIMTAAHVAALYFGNSREAAKKRLQKLKAAGLIAAQTLRISFVKPWDFLAKTNLAVRETGSISERTSLMWRRGELNPENE